MKAQGKSNYLKLLRDEGEIKEHYKMYKAGRRWLFAGISLFTVGAGLMLGQASASADSTSDPMTAQTVATADKALSAENESTSTDTQTNTVPDTSTSEAAESTKENVDTSVNESASNENQAAAKTTTTVATNNDATSETSSNLAKAQSSVPEGATVQSTTDGTTEIELPAGEDGTATQKAVTDAGVTGAVTIKAKDAAQQSSVMEYDASVSKTDSNYKSGAAAVADQLANNVISMPEYADLLAIADGTANGGSTNVDDLYTWMSGKYTSTGYYIMKPGSSNHNYLVGYFDTIASAMYQFENAYIPWLDDQLTALTQAQANDLANGTYTSDHSEATILSLASRGGFFATHYLPLVGDKQTSDSTGNDEFAYFTQAIANDDYDGANWYNGTFTALQGLVNMVFRTYVSIIVPSIESYVVDTAVPSINTVAITQDIISNPVLSEIYSSVEKNALSIAESLMTREGEYSLTTMLPESEMLQGKILFGSVNVGVYVGAYQSDDGTTMGNPVIDPATGKPKTFDTFDVFQSLYEAYSKAIVKSLYTYAMQGKYRAIQMMYDGTLDDFVGSATGPTGLNVDPTDSAADTTGGIDGDKTKEMYQQGLWDVYEFVEPFYKQGLADASSADGIKRSDYTSDQDYANAVFNRVTSLNSLKETDGTAITSTNTDVTDATKQYLAEFYKTVTTNSITVAFVAPDATSTAATTDANGVTIPAGYKEVDSKVYTGLGLGDKFNADSTVDNDGTDQLVTADVPDGYVVDADKQADEADTTIVASDTAYDNNTNNTYVIYLKEQASDPADATVSFFDETSGEALAETSNLKKSGFVGETPTDTTIAIPDGYALADDQDAKLTVTKDASGSPVSVAYNAELTADTTDDVAVNLVEKVKAPDESTSVVAKDADGNVIRVTKEWPDGTKTVVAVDKDTGVETVYETPNGQDPLTPVTVQPGATTVIDDGDGGQTTVTNDSPDGTATLSHTAGDFTSVETSVDTQGNLTYGQVGDPVSVNPDDAYSTTETTDPDGTVTTVTKDGNDQITDVEKEWPDGDTTNVHVDVDTGTETVTETPKGEDSLTPVTVAPGETTTVGKTTVENDKPDGVVSLTHDPADDSGTTDGESVAEDGTVTYTKSAVDVPAVSVTADDFYTTTETTDPDGSVATVTTNGNDQVTNIEKDWLDGDATNVSVDVTTGVETVTETPNGEAPLDPVTVNPGETVTVGKTTVANDEPDGTASLSHDPEDGTGTVTGDEVDKTGTVTATTTKSAVGDPVSVTPDDFYTTTETKDPDGTVTTVTKDGNDQVTNVEKDWPDGDSTNVHVDVDTGVETVTETPNGEAPLDPVTVNPGETVTTGKTTVTNDKPDGVVSLTHDPSDGTTDGESVAEDGTISYTKSAVGDPLSVDPADAYTTTETKGPDGTVTTVTKDGNDQVTNVEKDWPDGDTTNVHVDVDTGVETVTETPKGESPLEPVTVNPGETVTTGKTTVTNDKPDGVVSLTHDPADGSGTTTGENVDKDGTVTYTKSAVDVPAVSVNVSDAYTTTETKDPDGTVTTVTKDGNNQVTDVEKDWPDGDTTNVHVDVDTGTETVTETPKGKDPLAPVTVAPGETTTVGKTTVENDKPDGVVSLTHDPADGSGKTDGETVDGDGTVTYTKSAVDVPAVSVNANDYYTTTETKDPDGTVTTVTKDGNSQVTTIEKDWPDGDTTTVHVDVATGVETVTETPKGKDPLAPVTVKPGETVTTGKTTVTNDKPAGVASFKHDGDVTGNGQLIITVNSDGSEKYSYISTGNSGSTTGNTGNSSNTGSTPSGEVAPQTIGVTVGGTDRDPRFLPAPLPAGQPTDDGAVKNTSEAVSAKVNTDLGNSETAQKLPQTGEQETNASAILGLSLLGMMLGWFGFKRKKED